MAIEKWEKKAMKQDSREKKKMNIKAARMQHRSRKKDVKGPHGPAEDSVVKREIKESRQNKKQGIKRERENYRSRRKDINKGERVSTTMAVGSGSRVGQMYPKAVSKKYVAGSRQSIKRNAKRDKSMQKAWGERKDTYKVGK